DTATVSLTVTPVAVDDAVTAPFQTPVTVDVTANDHGTGLTVTSVTQPAPGTGSVAIVAGKPVYTPPSGYVGTTTFTYTVTDSSGQTSTATVTVTVAPPGAPVAVDDHGTTPVNTPLTVPAPGVLSNDSGSGLTVQSNTAPAHGSVTVHADGSYTYTPDTDYSGPDSFTYTIVDALGATSTATVHLTVTPTAVDDSATTPPATPVTIDVVANDHGSGLTLTTVTQPPKGQGTVKIVGGKAVYTPPAGFSGTTTFTYTVTDSSGQTATATVTVTVPAAPVPASATDDLRHGQTGQPVSLHPTDNDTPSTGATWRLDTLRLIDPATGKHVTTLVVSGEGTWTVGAGGTVTFTPESGFTADPTPVRYTVEDSAGNAVVATITIVYPEVSGPGTLPHTGATGVADTLWVGIGALLAGVLLLLTGSRRRRRGVAVG
ncbi:MAG TPA: Ig-like domain-containing protein, partial [Acidimicrobiales bacterium]|nr:Ig-like domain-containing protein [Acidimicrobiales bacterium]